MTFGAIVVAAGSGERLGADVPKALVEVAGRPLVCHAVDRLRDAGAAPVVVVAPPDAVTRTRQALGGAADEVTVVAGGARRADSVRAGLAALPEATTVVAVHDAARGLAPVAMVRRVVAAVTGDVVAAAPALTVSDTLKTVDGDTVLGTVDRSAVVAVQTPQVFAAEALRAAHAVAADATDDLALVEVMLADGRLDGRVVVVAGEALAMKVTHPSDLAVVAALAAQP